MWSSRRGALSRNGHNAEWRALQRCDLIIMSSQWAIDSAVNDYGVDPARTALVSFGANMAVDWTGQDVEAFIADRPSDICRLLFIGVDWQRKGGPAALAVAEELERRGIDVELTVVGCEPEYEGAAPRFVNALGFGHKNQPEGAARLAELLRRSHFLILPTRADCTPIVFNEAASFGLPSLTRKTGGVPSVIEDGVNGLLFDLDAPASACADAVQRLLNEPEAYAALARSTFAEYERRLNWVMASRRIRTLLENLLVERTDATVGGAIKIVFAKSPARSAKRSPDRRLSERFGGVRGRTSVSRIPPRLTH
jgi:glycosyltransferase involved in cell wall biosynthesis